jgi:hypothetical protein
VRKNRWLVLLFCCLATSCFAVQTSQARVEFKIFELYSWQQSQGKWVSSLLPAVSNAGFHPDVIRNSSDAIPGLSALEKRLKTLPAESEIIWLDHATGMWKKAKGWDSIKLPPTKVVQRVRQYCEERHLKLSIDADKN